MLHKNLLTDNCQIQPRKHLCLEDTNKMLMFMESKEKHKELEKCLDSQLWHACAGGMVQMPPVNSKVYYFPQGHAEHACGQVDFRNLPHVPASVLCRVSAIQFLADSETDEVYAKLKLIPLRGSDFGLDDEEAVINGAGGEENKPASFAKTLTQSDANNGGGFSVPRYCAETIFPRLDYSADPPVQTILAKDVHGETWKFRHIYRGTPRRHLLTTGWSTFVNHKKLVAGDSIVFLRANNGDLCVGIRRAKRGFGGGPESSWNPAGGNCGIPYGCFTSFLKEDEHKLMRNGNANGSSLGLNGGLTGMGKLRPESVIEAASLATAVQPFEVVYYPRSSSPEFCVKASLVKAAMHKRWFPGLRFKMAFETEDSSRISWFMGTVSSAQAADSLRWPDSPWRLLQVTWDEPDLLQNVKRVSPWLVELVPTMPAVHLSPYAPPRKKLRFLPHSDFPLDGQFPLPGYSSTYLGLTSLLASPPENSPAGMQGARHAHYGLSLSDIHLKNLQKGHFLDGFSSQLDRSAVNSRAFKSSVMHNPSINENISCMLTMTNSTQTSKKPDDTKVGQLVLFGQTILTEQQISQSCSNDTAPVCTGNSSSEGNFDKMANFSDGSGSARHPQSRPEQSSCEGSECYKQDTDNSTDNGHCKVFVESKHVSHTLDLSLLKSYEELRHKLGNMFRIEDSKPLGNVYYRDVTGAVRQIGDEPFRDFMKSARTIVTDSSGDNVGV